MGVAGIILLIMAAVFSFSVLIPVFSKKYKTKSMKIMILGIEITIIGGIVAVDSNSSLGGFEYIITLIGLIISISIPSSSAAITRMEDRDPPMSGFPVATETVPSSWRLADTLLNPPPCIQ